MKTSLAPLLVLLLGQSAFGQWSTNPAVNNAICTDFYVQNSIQMISDDSGGAIIAWLDYRLPGYTVFAQRISGNGVNQWTNNGVQVSLASINGQTPSMVSDGNGGAIIAWSAGGDFATNCVQRINSGGVLQWGSSGVVVAAGTGTQQGGAPKVTSDGNGGAIVAWNDRRNNVNVNDDDVYAQRLDSSGAVQWGAEGVAVATNTGYQGSLQLAGDGTGGAVIAWQDTRSIFGVDVYAQKVNAAGGLQWTTNGVALATNVGGTDRYLQLVGDAGGAIICWEDRRNGTDFNIYAQKVDSIGAPQWTANGVAACSAANNQQFPQLATDGSGGAIICWEDQRPTAAGIRDIYAQRIDLTGAAQWTADGQPVCAQTNSQSGPQIAPDGSGGATITWTDGRSATNPNDVYAQRINASGNILWTTNGVAVSTATSNQRYPFIINDGSNGMIISFQDSRSDPTRDDIYAQRLNPDGTLGRVVPIILTTPLRPNASRFQFTVSGTAGRTYIFEASDTLTNWVALATNVAPSDVFNYTNSNATNAVGQFYRVKQGP
jgi:hypothetical protein